MNMTKFHHRVQLMTLMVQRVDCKMLSVEER